MSERDCAKGTFYPLYDLCKLWPHKPEPTQAEMTAKLAKGFFLREVLIDGVHIGWQPGPRAADYVWMKPTRKANKDGVMVDHYDLWFDDQVLIQLDGFTTWGEN